MVAIGMKCSLVVNEYMKIDFNKLKVHTGLDKKEFVLTQAAKELADGLYKTAMGISGYALALKLYNSKGEEEYTEEEFSMIMNYANKYGTPFFIDALQRLKEDERSNDLESTETNE